MLWIIDMENQLFSHDKVQIDCISLHSLNKIKSKDEYLERRCYLLKKASLGSI